MGMLEDVCLESVVSEPVMECIERFLECVKERRTDWPKQNIDAKARVHTFLASQDPPDLRLGEAAARGFWDFDAAAFEPLRNILQGL